MSEDAASPPATVAALPTGEGEGNLLEVFLVFLRLGLTSFGGPVAHLGYMQRELVEHRRWVDESAYADLVALCQFLPGPASSQVAISLGLARAGIPGAVAAWLGFALPSAVALVLFALGVEALGGSTGAGWIHGLKVVAVPVIALAVHGMARSLCPDRARGSIAFASAIVVTLWPTGLAQVGIMAIGGLLGWLIYRGLPARPGLPLRTPLTRTHAVLAWAVFVGLLVALPVLARLLPSCESLLVFQRFYRTGSLVFGGGHVVLPLLDAEVVKPGWTTDERFLAGYGAAQAVPGPLFSFAAYLGAIVERGPRGWAGASLALSAIYLPSFLLLAGCLPFWERLRASRGCQAALRGTNAAVVGLLLSALYNPAWTCAIVSANDFVLALGVFALLALWKAPPWLVVLATAVASGVLAPLAERA